MKLIWLKLLNFRKFKQEEVLFSDNFCLIFGKNWSWKSSLLDAIWYALFWPSSKDFTRWNTKLLKSYFIKDRSPSKVELTFQHWLKTYKVVRVIDSWIKKLSSDFILETKDTLIWENVEIIWWKEVSDFILDMLQVPRDTFLRSVFAKQKDLEVLAWPKEERKKLINSILGIDKIENLIIDLKSKNKTEKIKLDILKKDIEDFDLDLFKKEKKELKWKYKIITQEYKSYKKEYELQSSKFEKIKKQYDEMSKKKNQYDILSNNVSLNLKDIKNHNENIEIIKKDLEKIIIQEKYLKDNAWIIKKEADLFSEIWVLERQKKDYEYFLELKSKLYKNNSNLDSIIKNINKYNKDYKLIISNKEKDLENTEIEFNENMKLITSFNVEIKNIKKDWEEIKQELEQLLKLWDKANCPTCKRPLDKYLPNLIKMFQEDLNKKRKLYLDVKSKLDEYTKKQEQIDSKIKNIKNEIKKLKEEEQQREKLLYQKEELEKTIQTQKIEMDKYKDINYDENIYKLKQQEYKKIKEELSKYRQIEWQVNKKQELLEKKELLEKNLKKIKKDLQINLKNIDNLKFKEEDFLNLKTQYDLALDKKDEINKKLKDAEIEKLRIKYLLDESDKKKIEHDKKIEKFNLLKKDITYNFLKIDILSDYMLYLLNHLKPLIQDLASNYFRIMTDNKYFEISFDDEYNILIDGKSIELYSWWEKDLANLCIRLSLGQNLSTTNWNSINFLILDEVLGSQDKQRQQNILMNLKKLEDKFSQIILVSHLEELKELSTSLIEVKSWSQGDSKIIMH